MPDTKIHPTAVVEPGAEIGENVTIEPYAIIKGTVTLKDNVVIKAHAYIDGYTTIGEGTTVWPGASIGTKSQDLKFQGEQTFVEIGANCEIREFATINSSTTEGSVVRIGDGCLIMAYCHIAHNCVLGNHVVMSNNATLAGHVTIEDWATIGGFSPIHQFARVGRYAFVGGLSRVTHDVPPYTIGGGIPFKFGGLNLVGLKRHGLPLETRKVLSRAFNITFRSGLHIDDALERIQSELDPIPEVEHWLQFCRDSKRGLIGLQDKERSVEEFEFLEDCKDEVLDCVAP